MTFLSRLADWIKRKRRSNSVDRPELREFVYLDEVSVYSLYASRKGAIAKEFTDSVSRSIEGGLSSSFGDGVTSEASAKLAATRVNGSQVLRRSVIQTTFKELYEHEVQQGSIELRPMSGDSSPSDIKSLEDFQSRLSALREKGWIVDPEHLKRGALIEVEVQLEAEATFKLIEAISAVSRVVEGSSEMFGNGLGGQLRQMSGVSKLLEELLVGLVPLRGQSIEYQVLVVDGKLWVVHRKLLKSLQQFSDSEPEPLFVVGVAERSLFWKDTRRILFSQSNFRVLCRVSQSGIVKHWSPVKLADVLGSVAPSLVGQLQFDGRGVLAQMAETTSSAQRKSGLKPKLFQNALVRYAELLVAHYEQVLSPEHMRELTHIADANSTSFESAKERRSAFRHVSAFVSEHLAIDSDHLIHAQYRAVAMDDVGLNHSMELTTPNPAKSDRLDQPSDHLINVEFVAIYW